MWIVRIRARGDFKTVREAIAVAVRASSDYGRVNDHRRHAGQDVAGQIGDFHIYDIYAGGTESVAGRRAIGGSTIAEIPEIS